MSPIEPRCNPGWRRPSQRSAFLLAFGLLNCFALARGAIAQTCPDTVITGSVSSGDGSTIPGSYVNLYATGCQPNCYVGAFPPGSITLKGGITGDWSSQFYAIAGGYFWSPIAGNVQCHRDTSPPYCTTCGGSFDLLLYASEGAIDGTLTVVPPLDGGVVGLSVWLGGPGGPSGLGTTTDATGHFEFRDQQEPYRANNWGVAVDGSWSPWPHSATGSKSYLVGYGESFTEADVTSSQLTSVSLTGRNPRVEDPEMRGSCSANVGAPVNVLTGNVWFDQIDAVVAGVSGLRLVRAYNSKNAYRGVGGGFGRGWTHSYEKSLVAVGTRSIDLRGADGVPIYYYDVGGDGIFEAVLPGTERSRIVRAPDGTYTRNLLAAGHETYDAAGRLMSIVTLAGQAIDLMWDAWGRLVRVADPGGRSLTFGYDAQSRITSLSSGGSVLASYGYDDLGRLETVSYPDGSGYSFTYDGSGQVLTVKDSTGRTTETHTYDSGAYQGYALSSEIADGRERYTFSYDRYGRTTTVTDALGNVTTYSWGWFSALKSLTKMTGPCGSCGGSSSLRVWAYDEKGRVAAATDGAGKTTSYVYDTEGNLVSETDPLGNTTTHTYDSLGRVLTTHRPDGGVTTFTHGPAGPLKLTQELSSLESRTTAYTYTDDGQLASITDPRGKTTVLEYGPSGDLVSIRDALGGTSLFTYDALGRRLSSTDALGRRTTTSYDAAGRIASVTDPAGATTRYAYDLGGRRISVTDPMERMTTYGYDTWGRLETVTDPAGGVTAYGYDLMSHLTSLTDSKGQTTSFDYDALGQLQKTTWPGGPFESYGYDDAQRLVSRIDRRGITTSYGYDDAGRLTGKTYSDGTPPVSYGYDTVGRLVSAANGSDALSFAYDLAGQLLSEASAANASTVSYGYDPAGNRVALGLNGQPILGYGYDDAGRLASVQQVGMAAPFAFDYDAAGQRRLLQYPGGSRTLYAYNAAGELTFLAFMGRSQRTLGQRDAEAPAGRTAAAPSPRPEGPTNTFRYEYNLAGNRVSKTTEWSLEAYAYDNRDRLVSVTRQGMVTEAYGYDEVGNRLSSVGLPAWSYNERNELLSNGESGFSYDPNGNLATKTEAGASWSYEWNAENQLARVTKNGAEVARYAYDPLGRRIAVTPGPASTEPPRRFLYDGEDVLRLVSGEGPSTSTRHFVHGPGIDEPLAYTEAGQSGFSFFHADGLGSITHTTDASGRVALSRSYEAFGAPLSGTTRMRSPTAVQPECPTCSNMEGGFMSNLSKRMKKLLGF
jgi:YD repeat-containing protein